MRRKITPDRKLDLLKGMKNTRNGNFRKNVILYFLLFFVFLVIVSLKDNKLKKSNNVVGFITYSKVEQMIHATWKEVK